MNLFARRQVHQDGYSAPTRNAPQWYAGYLVFRNGQTMLKRSSMTGGGQLYKHDNPGTFQPVIVMHVGPTAALTGSGQLLAKPGFLQSLGLNPNGQNTGN